MIIKCETLEQVKKIVEIEGWDDWNDRHFERVANTLEEEPVCVDTDDTGYVDGFSIYLNDNLKVDIINFEDSKYTEGEVDKMENKNNCEIIENESPYTPTTTQIEDVIALLKVSGYTITPPRITEEQAIEKIKEENEKIGYVPNWEDEDEDKYLIYYDGYNLKYEYRHNKMEKSIGVTYTTEEIAEKICKELNGEVV